MIIMLPTTDIWWSRYDADDDGDDADADDDDIDGDHKDGDDDDHKDDDGGGDGDDDGDDYDDDGDDGDDDGVLTLPHFPEIQPVATEQAKTASTWRKKVQSNTQTAVPVRNGKRYHGQPLPLANEIQHPWRHTYNRRIKK